AQGTDIHVAPGQEQHLPHEAWHVVQQAQGRVRPTMQMKEGVPVNDDQSLEHEADVMGGRAVQAKEDKPMARYDVVMQSSQGGGSITATHPARTLQLMTFSRFTRGGIFTNWGFYSETEKKILSQEAALQTQLDELRIDDPGALNEEAEVLRTKFQEVSSGDYTTAEYSKVTDDLSSLGKRVNALSNKMSIWLKNRDSFNAKSGEIPAREAIVPRLKKFSLDPKLYILPELKELLDVAGQMVSDAIIFTKDQEEPIIIKEKIIQASTEIQEAFLSYVIQQNEKLATTRMLIGCSILASLDFTALSGLLDNKLIKPKQRESGWRIDVGSMMLARSTALDNFVPDLVVGLPTAGAHIASRLAASYGLITGHTPEVNLTRAHAVKQDSKTMMTDVRERDYLKPGEVERLVNRLKQRMGKRRELTIFIVDDGMVSGNTIKITHDLYARKMQEAGFNVLIKTGLARGNSYESPEEVVRPDYVIEPRHDWGGDSRLMEEVPSDERKDVGSAYEMDEQWSSKSKLSLEVELVSGTLDKPAIARTTICDMLKPVEKLELEYKKDERLPKGFKFGFDEPNYHIAGTENFYS
ncbi:MAG: hypothetical protein ACYCZR_05710, partial [Burkholderiales bacterium]